MMKKRNILLIILSVLVAVLLFAQYQSAMTIQSKNEQLAVYTSEHTLNGSYKTEDHSLYISLEYNKSKAYIRYDNIIDNQLTSQVYTVDYTQKDNCIFINLEQYGKSIIVDGKDEITLITENQDVYELKKYSDSIQVF